MFSAKLLSSFAITKNHLNYYRYISRFVYGMDKAYLRHCPDGENFEFSFELKDNVVNRTFNFSRKLSEPVEQFTTRVKTNVDKFIMKKTKKKQEPPQLSTISILLNEKEVANGQTCQEVFSSNGSIQLSINDKRFTIVINSPWVTALDLPTSILATFPTYPSKFETVFTDKLLSDFQWYKSRDNKTWEEVGRDFIYTPNHHDIDCWLKLRCVPRNQNSVGPEFEAVTSSKVQASPGICPFERRQQFTSNKLRNNEFRVMTYNLLADLYCDSDFSRQVLFPYCPPDALNIDYRKQLFMKEIIGYNADLICLQEVDRHIYKYDLVPVLSHLGYTGTYHMKGVEVGEGLSFFHNTSRFIQLDSEKLVFGDQLDKHPVFHELWESIRTNEKLAARILARTTTLSINVVGSLDRDEIVVVANTHMYFHPDSDHIRLLHGCAAILYMEHFVHELKLRYDKRISLVFCGDFNSVPSCGIYKLFTTGFVPGNLADYSSNSEETIQNVDVRQPFKLSSACGTPKYTNFTAGFADCLDYIYYDTESLSVSQSVPLPTDEELKENVAIPSRVFPSDHIALVADLKWS